tara:strand:- start:373 stop:624 length:252 start_codon:yes stop_codon:yes gene_type:complete
MSKNDNKPESSLTVCSLTAPITVCVTTTTKDNKWSNNAELCLSLPNMSVCTKLDATTHSNGLGTLSSNSLDKSHALSNLLWNR